MYILFCLKYCDGESTLSNTFFSLLDKINTELLVQARKKAEVTDL